MPASSLLPELPRKIRLIRPSLITVQTQRRDSTLTMQLLALLAVTLVAFWSLLCTRTLQNPHHGLSLFSVLVLPLMSIVGLYAALRLRPRMGLVYFFISSYLVLGTYALYLYGYTMPEGLLTYMLVIIIAGMRISNRAAFGVTAAVLVCMCFLFILQHEGIDQPDVDDLTGLLSPVHVIIYIFFFAAIFMVALLSNRDLERSLQRAQKSEAALRKQRNLLETKVRARTRQLEKDQMEKLMELQRFAEFGRLSSTLLHDLVNPLSAVSIELELLAETKHSSLIREARKGIASMERYIDGARRQLRNEGTMHSFAIAEEIRRVCDFTESRARAMHVKVELELDESLRLYGDSIRFDQIIANLVANGIDAYEGFEQADSRRLVITSENQNQQIIISVRDYASGIEQMQLAHIFEAFYTTKSPERGSGLGLSIIKQSVEHDFAGTISVTSQPQQGTCFTVSLPIVANDIAAESMLG